MHDIAVIRISAQDIRHYLAESPGEQSFVYVPDSFMYIFFGGGYTPHAVFRFA
jgi:phage baseplate assembly protein gpV